MPDIMTKKAHFFTINPLSSEQVDYIKLWAKTNTDYEIIVSGNIKLSLKKSIYKVFFDKVRRDSVLSENFNQANSNQRLLRTQIDDIMVKLSPSDYKASILSELVQPEAGKIIEDLEAREQTIEKLEQIDNITIRDFSEKLDANEINLLTHSVFLSDSQLAETYLSLKTIEKHGGVLLDKNTLPKLNDSLFQGIISDENNIDTSVLERAKIELILIKLYEEGRIESFQQQVSSENYPAIPKNIFEEIKNIIDSTNSDDLFLPLGDISLDNNEILLANQPGAAIHKPIILAAHPNSAFTREAWSEVSTIYKAAYSTNKKIIHYEEAFSVVQKHFTNKAITLSKQKTEAITSALFNLNYANNNDYFFDSEFYGAEALERTAQYLADKQTIKSTDFNAYSSNTPEQSKEIKAYNFNQYELFGRASYDSLIYLKIGSNKLTISDLDYYDNKSIPGRSVLYYLDPGDSTLNLQVLRGQPLTSINRKTRIIITGHRVILAAPDSQSSDDSTPVKRIATVGGASPEVVVAALKKIAPAGMRIKEINFICCNLAENYSGNAGAIKEGSGGFIPQFLMTLKNNGINAIEVTASTQDVTTSPTRKKIFFYGIKDPNTSKRVATPYPGRYIFRHDISKGNIYYYAKPGLSSYEPDISVIDPKLPNSNLNPGVFLNKKMTPPDGKKNTLITEPEKVILALMSEGTASDRIIVTNKDKYILLRLIKQLKLSFNYASYKSWIEGIRIFRPSQLTTITAIEQTYTSDADRETAFKRMKGRVQNGNLLEFYHLDIHTPAGAEALNYLYPGDFARIDTDWTYGCRISRSPTGDDNCSSKTKEAASNLNLLSGPSTELRINSANTDIALVDTSQDEKQAEFQQQYVDARREEARVKLKTRKGYHSLIALDNTSFTLANNIARAAGGDKTRAFLLKATPSCGLVIFNSESEIEYAIAAGPDNPVTLVGRGESLNAERIANLITELTPESKIRQLTLTGMTVDSLQEGSNSLNEIKRFIARDDRVQVDTLVIEPLNAGAKSLAQLAQRIKNLLSDITPSIKSITLRSENNEDTSSSTLDQHRKLEVKVLTSGQNQQHPVRAVRSRFAPKIIHFSAIAPLSPERLEYIKIWARVNTDYQIKLWFSENFSIDKFIYLVNFEILRKLQRLEFDYTSLLPDINDKIWEQVDWYKSNRPQDKSYRDHVAEVIPDAFGQRYQSFLAELDQLKQEVKSVSNIQLIEFNSPFDIYESAMVYLSLNKSDSGLAEYLIGMKSTRK